MGKRALITGITGQDGSFLSEFLLEKGYEVHGIIRRSSVDFRERIAHLEGRPGFHLHYADLGDSMSIVKVVGYTGTIEWDTSRPNGTPRKLLDVSKATALGWTYKTELEDGIRLAYQDFLTNPMRAER